MYTVKAKQNKKTSKVHPRPDKSESSEEAGFNVSGVARRPNWHNRRTAIHRYFLAVVIWSLCVQLFCNPMDCGLSGSSLRGFLWQEYWSGLLFPSSGIFLNQYLVSCLVTRFYTTEPPGKPISWLTFTFFSFILWFLWIKGAQTTRGRFIIRKCRSSFATTGVSVAKRWPVRRVGACPKTHLK